MSSGLAGLLLFVVGIFAATRRALKNYHAGLNVEAIAWAAVALLLVLMMLAYLAGHGVCIWRS